MPGPGARRNLRGRRAGLRILDRQADRHGQGSPGWRPGGRGGDRRILEPRGSRRANSLYTLEIELRKGYRVAGLDLELIGTVENVLGTERPVAVCQLASGCTSVDGDPIALGRPTGFEPTRR